MTTPPMWEFQITPEQGQKIALVSANWAIVDYELGHLISTLAGVSDTKDGADLVHILDLKKKIDLIESRRKDGRLRAEAAEMSREMRWVAEHYRPDRNMLAHGIIAGEAQIVWSHSKQKILDLGHLDALVSEAQYAAHVAHRLLMLGLGAPSEALPPRPPLRPETQ